MEMAEKDMIEREFADNYPYFVKQGDGPPANGTEVRQKTNTFYALTNDDYKPSFAELTLYTLLCRERKQLSDETGMEIFPKGEYPYKRHGNPDEIDALLRLNREIFPVEVYNGIQLLDMSKEKKREQLIKNSVPDEKPANNPVLTSRLAAEEMRSFVRGKNGSVIDTGVIVACKETNPNLEEAAKFLNLEQRIEIIPRIKTEEGYELDGEKYDKWATKHPNRLLPKNLDSSADILPESYTRPIRGGLHLLYVNTFYRKSSNIIEKESSMLLQNAFHALLRHSSGMVTNELLETGWDRFEDNYSNIKKAKPREKAIRDKAREYISTLQEQNILIRRSGDLHVRASDHPHASLRFPEGYQREL